MRHLPILYGGHDAGPRPETRRQVYAALARGVDPVLVVEHVAAGLSQVWEEGVTALEQQERPPACARGCSFCCHQRVEVTAPEVFLLVRWLTTRRPTEVVAWTQRVARLASQRAGVSAAEHFAAQLPCVFITADGACAVYEARPLACRRAHSTDAQICETAATQPDRGVRVPVSESIDWNTSALVLGYYEGSAHAGLAPAQYELIAALALAMTLPNAEARWGAGEDVLESARTRSAEQLASVLGGANDVTPRTPRRR